MAIFHIMMGLATRQSRQTHHFPRRNRQQGAGNDARPKINASNVRFRNSPLRAQSVVVKDCWRFQQCPPEAQLRSDLG
jgi:hypothetical protein